MATTFKTVVTPEMEATIKAAIGQEVITLEHPIVTEKEEGVENLAFGSAEVVNYLADLGSADRFTGAIIGKSYTYRTIRKVRKFDPKKPKFLILFKDKNLKTHSWFMDNFLTRVHLDKHKEDGGLTVEEYAKSTKMHPSSIIVLDAIPRTFQYSDYVVTSQMCWDFAKLQEQFDKIWDRVVHPEGTRKPDHCRTLKTMQQAATTYDMISSAYESLSQIDPLLYIRDRWLEGGQMSTEGKKNFVICDIVVKALEIAPISSM